MSVELAWTLKPERRMCQSASVGVPGSSHRVAPQVLFLTLSKRSNDGFSFQTLVSSEADEMYDLELSHELQT